jgi:hypothetical protein
MTTIKATPLEIEFQKEMHPFNLAKKVPKLYPNPTPHCFPCQMHHHQIQREGIAHLHIMKYHEGGVGHKVGIVKPKRKGEETILQSLI